MLVVVIVGLLAAIAVPSFNRYVKQARSVEAIGVVEKLYTGAVTYYEADRASGSGAAQAKQFPLPPGGYAEEGGHPACGCLPAGVCPGLDPAFATPVFQALNYAITSPHRYRAEYWASGTGTGSRFTAVACGDLDCNGVYAEFTRRGWVTSSGDVTGDRSVFVLNPTE